MQERFISSFTGTKGKLEYSWGFCDGSTCMPDLLMAIRVPNTPDDYLYIKPESMTVTSDNTHFQKFVVTDASGTAGSDDSAGIQLLSGEENIYDQTVSFGASYSTSWETVLGNCTDPLFFRFEDEGSVAAYIGSQYAVFVQFISAVDSAPDVVTAQVTWFELISGNWDWQDSQTINVVQGLPANPFGITGLVLETDNDVGCATPSSALTVRVPGGW